MPPRSRKSAGLLLFQRHPDGSLTVLLAHPGGPFYARKDAGAWSIPKGELDGDEDPLACAKRELTEETGLQPPVGEYIELGSIQQRGGKQVQAWAVEGSWPGGVPQSNTFTLEWPPRSGKLQAFPEIDRYEPFSVDEARVKINPAQVAFLERLLAAVEP
ncbi:MAG: NUDIX domain-containing protein [Polyangiales bacterium]